LFYPEDAVVNPRDVVGALKTACLGRGIRFRENEPVVSISAGDATAAVTTAAGTWEADAVILAAGAWSSSIKVSTKGVDVALPRSYPVRGHLLGYQLRPGMLTPILRHGHTYLLQRSSGFLVAGTTSEEAGFDRTVDPSAAADIERRATRLLPCLAGAGAPAAWIGFRPGAAEPVSGRAPGARALWLSYGHYRNGILLAPACAARLAAAISASAETGLPSISGNP
jgi:glycine oxidase